VGPGHLHEIHVSADLGEITRSAGVQSSEKPLARRALVQVLPALCRGLGLAPLAGKFLFGRRKAPLAFAKRGFLRPLHRQERVPELVLRSHLVLEAREIHGRRLESMLGRLRHSDALEPFRCGSMLLHGHALLAVGIVKPRRRRVELLLCTGRTILGLP
jgi:hypothetical protein